MFSLFFDGIQQDLQIAILPPVLCALFRLIFIEVYRAKKHLLVNGANGITASDMAFGGEWI